MSEKIGIDLGSRSVKIAIAKGSAAIELFDYDSIFFYDEFGSPKKDGFKLDMRRLGLGNDASIYATGYGRNALNIAGAKVVPEIQAHTRGAIYQTGFSDFTLIDLGGQDSKVISVRDSVVFDFYMNDRCAASAGRYLENMAKVLGLTLAELSSYYDNPEPLTTICAVFGESELVSKIARGVAKERLAAGVNAQIIRRIAGPLESRKPKRIVLVGGVALNGAIAKLLAAAYSVPVIIPEHPQHNAALGLLAPGRQAPTG